MSINKETMELIALKTRLSEEQDMIGWLCTVHLNSVNYKNNPQASQKIQTQLNITVDLISLAYMWAVLDESGFNEHNTWISTDDKSELIAWKHVRHTAAHAPGGRAKGYYDEFDIFMNGSVAGTSGLKQNCTFTVKSISIGTGMSIRFFEFARNIVDKAIRYCANGEKFV